jgi:hypothetical protein
MESVGTFYSHLIYITAILYILGPLGNLVIIWYILPRFGILHQEKSVFAFCRRTRRDKIYLLVKTCL